MEQQSARPGGGSAERLDRFAQTADEIHIADRGFGSRPECIRSFAFGEADYIVRIPIYRLISLALTIANIIIGR